MEEELDAVWGVYRDAMVATTGEGESDHRARLAAVEGLLAQAYGRPPQQLVGDVGRPVAITVVSAFAQEGDGVHG